MLKSKEKLLPVLGDYAALTGASLLFAMGMYFFRFPNHFSFGGVAGIAVELAHFFPNIPTTVFMTGMDVLLLIIGVAVLGRSFGVRTGFVVAMCDIFMNLGQALIPLDSPLTDQPVLEMIFAVGCHAVAASIMFDRNASSGGTDIIAMIVKKYASMNIGQALLITDAVIVASMFFVFDIRTGLFSVCGLVAKSVLIDGMIATIHRCKVLTIICKEPDKICSFITNDLHRTATIQQAIGAYTKEESSVIIAVVRPRQAHKLMKFIENNSPDAFIAMSNSSEIFGKGFLSHI